jgi:hypothetical protein
MIAERMKSRLWLATIATALVVLACASVAHAATYTGPIKENLHSSIGWEVNKNKAKTCLFATEECQPGRLSSEPGGFEFANGVAVDNDKASPHYGDVYVIDNSHRVQELSATGSFVSTFGWEVNKTKDETPGATQAEKNVCTAVSGNVCKAGVEGSAAGQFGEGLLSIAVDQANGDVYVADRVFHPTEGTRVQKFTADGQFVLEIGREVNETTKGNLCTEEEVKTNGVKCTGPAQNVAETTEPGAFVHPGTLAVGGPEDLLYVGDEHRVQEFKADGKYKREISLTSISAAKQSGVTALAVAETGELYIVYEERLVPPTIIHRFAVNGEEVKDEHFPLTLHPRAQNAFNFLIGTLAIDSSNRLAVGESEQQEQIVKPFGSLLEGSTGRVSTEFEVPTKFAPDGLALSANDELYASAEHEVLAYTPVHVAELLTKSVTCAPGPVSETSATFGCMLNGEVNPEEVENTEVWFEWGKTKALGKETEPETVCTTSCGSTLLPVAPVAIESARPNQTFSYRLASHDQNAKAPEKLTSEKASFTTPTVPPRIVGAPSVPFVRSTSVVMFDELNPENAKTEYFFEYGTELSGCKGALRTTALLSAVYGKIGATLEATGLQPGATYQYRLCAVNEAGEPAVDESGGNKIPVGELTTAPAPTVQALTGSASAITATSAVVSGAVNPDGQPATYAFELGVYNGAAAQYGVVFSGSAGASTTFVEKTLALSGLQAGTAYAYRIKISSPGYGTAYGVPVTFTTEGLPSVLVVPNPLAMLAVPNIAFPKVVTPTTKVLTNAQKLAKALKACKKDKSRKQRAACQKQARKQYAKSKQANKRKKG